MLDAKEILNYLPHRYPFLLVDRIVEIHGDEKIVGIKNVSFNEPFFSGALPGSSGHAGSFDLRSDGAGGSDPRSQLSGRHGR